MRRGIAATEVVGTAVPGLGSLLSCRRRACWLLMADGYALRFDQPRPYRLDCS
jgi:hypothetical protein